MEDRYPHEADTVELEPIAQRLDANTGASGIGGVRGERVVIHAAQNLCRFVGSKQRNRGSLASHGKAEGPQIVETENVIGVAVRIENGIDASQVIAQRLFTKVRTGVDDEDAVAVGFVPTQQA